MQVTLQGLALRRGFTFPIVLCHVINWRFKRGYNVDSAKQNLTLCRERESNPHEVLTSQVFETCASANSATSATNT